MAYECVTSADPWTKLQRHQAVESQIRIKQNLPDMVKSLPIVDSLRRPIEERTIKIVSDACERNPLLDFNVLVRAALYIAAEEKGIPLTPDQIDSSLERMQNINSVPGIDVMNRFWIHLVPMMRRAQLHRG